MELMKKCEFAKEKIGSVLGLQLSCNETIDLGIASDALIEKLTAVPTDTEDSLMKKDQ